MQPPGENPASTGVRAQSVTTCPAPGRRYWSTTTPETVTSHEVAAPHPAAERLKAGAA